MIARGRAVYKYRLLLLDERSYEGYVAKDEASAYEGGRTRRWLKVKVPGWTMGDERWTRRISVDVVTAR